MKVVSFSIPVILLWQFSASDSFAISKIHASRKKDTAVYQNIVSEIVDAIEDVEKEKKREELKDTIVQLGASYDRGFSASPRVRTKMENLLLELERLNPETNASRFIDGPQFVTPQGRKRNSTSMEMADTFNSQQESSLEMSPLTGNWRMIWTTAQDVLVLGASPVVTVGAIYQFISPPTVTNVIDLIPRFQNVFSPSIIPNSMARAEVTTKASFRKSNPNRIGLNFERVEFKGLEFWGQDVSKLFPPLAFNLPRINLPEDVGYFDVTYLDSEMLLIRQNSPGGCFVLVNVQNDTDP